jgi:hypothetical protein
VELVFVRLPKNARVVLLEDSPMRIAWFQKRIPDLVVCKSSQEFKDYFTKGHERCDFIFWDHDLGGQDTSEEVAQWFVDRYGAGNTYALIHSWNTAGARKLQDIMNGVKWIPFGQFEVEVEA